MMQLQWRRQGTEAGGGQNKCRMRKIPRGGGNASPRNFYV